MSYGTIPSAKAMRAIENGAYEAGVLKRCGHGRTWQEECSDCNGVWREDMIKNLAKQAARYGFRLVPLSHETENE